MEAVTALLETLAYLVGVSVLWTLAALVVGFAIAMLFIALENR